MTNLFNQLMKKMLSMQSVSHLSDASTHMKSDSHHHKETDTQLQPCKVQWSLVQNEEAEDVVTCRVTLPWNVSQWRVVAVEVEHRRTTGTLHEALSVLATHRTCALMLQVGRNPLILLVLHTQTNYLNKNGMDCHRLASTVGLEATMLVKIDVGRA